MASMISRRAFGIGALGVAAAGTLGVVGVRAASYAGFTMVDWEQVTTPGFTDDLAAVVFLSSSLPDKAKGSGTVAFIGARGEVSFLPTDRFERGFVAVNAAREVTFGTETEVLVVAGERSRVLGRRGTAPTEGWATALENGSFVYELDTDVSHYAAGQLTHASVPAYGGRIGVGDSTIYLGNSTGRTPVRRERLYRVQVGPEGVEPAELVARWTLAGAQEGWRPGPSSGLFVDGDLLAFAESAHRRSRGSTSTQLRLGSVDLTTGRYTSTPVLDLPGKDIATDGPTVSWFASAASARGHLWDGDVYQVDVQGSILAIDVRDPGVRTAGSVGPAALTAEDPLVHWEGSRLYAMLIDGDHAVLETYDLADLDAGPARLSCDDLARYRRVHGSQWPVALAAFERAR